ncbi:MAG: protein translocase subunit SecD [Alphaproteobacteria bacterium]|nr:protein translocase subunit SecD [Alphaproteobacteria bacterium]
MVYIERWKVILILIVAFLAIVYALPNTLPPAAVNWAQAHLPRWLPSQTVNLGLDLRGGSHLLLEVETDVVIQETLNGLVDQVRGDLRKEKIGYTELGVTDGKVSLRVIDRSQLDQARTLLHENNRDLAVTANGEGYVFVGMGEDYVRDRKLKALEQSIEIVRRRIDQTGTREPSIQRQGDNRILVQLPGVDNPEQIKSLLGQTAKLSFRFVDADVQPADIVAGRIPPGTEAMPSADRPGEMVVVQKRVILSGDTLVDAQATFQQGGEPVVSFRFDSVGAKKFGDATRENVGRLFAIVLDNKVISAPVIREPILGGSGVISGSFTTATANELAILLRAGALPAPIHILEERTVGPGLGADSIRAGTLATVIGTLLVVIFMLLSYGLFGVFANVALIFNVAMIFAVLSALQATLTLPGIAGIVLTVGTAVDANVLIFERIREEVRLGRTPIAAVDAGYSRAMSAIIDANLTTLIASVLLYTFGSGTIKGFAVTLSIGIVTSMFSAIMMTRLMVIKWLRGTKPKTIPI